MNANELNMIDVAWTTGYVVGQLPSQFILTKVRPSIWIPSCELVWTVLTFTLAAATTSNQVICIRFFVGLCESIFYPAAHFLIGSWYKPSELGKRACIFHASSALAGMFSGYLQSAVYTGLNGTLGKAGWQWLFIMVSHLWKWFWLPEFSNIYEDVEDPRGLKAKSMFNTCHYPLFVLRRSTDSQTYRTV